MRSGTKLVANVAELFLERHAQHLRTANEVRRIFEHDVLPVWANRHIGSIRKRDVVALLDDIVARGSPIQANRTFAAVRRFFSWCVSRDLIEASPATGISRPAPERSRDRVLTDDEIKRLLVRIFERPIPACS